MNIQSIAVTQAVKLLKAAGAQYAIQLEDGTVLKEGNPLKARKPAAKKIWRNRGVSEYVMGHLKGLTPDVGKNQAVIPFTDAYSKEAIQGNASASAHKLWGTGGYITHRNTVGIEVLRIA